MFTIFTLPKNFKDKHISLIQNNAIASWKKLGKDVEILVLGDEYGIASACKKYKVKNVKKVERNKKGTPLLSSAFEIAKKVAKNDILVYSNADIILTKDLVDVVKKLKGVEKYLVIGQRWDLDVNNKVVFGNDKKSREKFKKEVMINGKLHTPTGSDYFIYNKNDMFNLPPLAVGRICWDNWLIYESFRRGFKIVDATQVNFVVHQNHDYGHIVKDPEKRIHVSEAKENKKITNLNAFTSLTIEDANFLLTKDGLVKRNMVIEYFWFSVKAFGIFLNSILRGRGVQNSFVNLKMEAILFVRSIYLYCLKLF